MVDGAPTDASGETPREATHAAARRTTDECTRNVRRTVSRPVEVVVVPADFVVIAVGPDIEGDGDGEGVTEIPFARLNWDPPSEVNVTSNATPTQMAFASGRA